MLKYLLSSTVLNVVVWTLMAPAIGITAEREVARDIVVYGGTSGGVVAAITAKRLGKSVVLIEPTRHLGGLTTGGLGATDIGNKRAIGGYAREFYERVHRYYLEPSRWNQQTRESYFKGRTIHRENETAMWTFEPHAASEIIDDWVASEGVEVVFEERLDLRSKIEKEGSAIRSIRMESGTTYSAQMYIDASYEGDLMARAGVAYHVGRESNSVYGETFNGLQIARTIHHQFVKPVDPYRVPGDPASGLLPNITAMPNGQDGDGDHRIQAYNFRMCTTDVPENRVPWPKPDGYDELEYELLLRNFEAGDMRVPWSDIWMPNRKTDVNNNFAFSTDYIGKNYAYPNADFAEREAIWKEHERYQQGLMWTLANHPRVPSSIREVFQKNSLAKDEFIDNENWPRQLYVREARRMIGGYVMSEKNCKRQEVVTDSIGMGAYNMDSHNTQRFVTAEGIARNEGDVQIATKPYPIAYRSICPKASECTNLFVPVCMSASHIAYGSIRMEPVFMVLGQSAATAASLCIERHCSIQELDVTALQRALLEAQQVLDFE